MRRLLFLVGVGAVAAACSSFNGNDPQVAGGGDGTGTGDGDGGPDALISGQPGDLALTITPIADLTLIQGIPKTVPLTVTRGKELDGPITIKVTGLPSGITADPVTLDGTTGNLVLSASPTSVQGAATAVIEASIDTYKATTQLHAFVRGAPGAPDTTWGTNGKVLATTGAANTSTAELVLGKDDDVFSISGDSSLQAASVQNSIVHLDKTGARDGTYGAGGTAMCGTSFPRGGLIGPDGHLVVFGGGQTQTGSVHTWIATLTTGGVQDQYHDFGSRRPGGLPGNVTASGAYATAARDDGSFVFAFDYISGSRFCDSAHLDSTFAPIASYGEGGSVQHSVSFPVAMMIQKGATAPFALVSVVTDQVIYMLVNSENGTTITSSTYSIPGVARPDAGPQGLVALPDSSIVIPFNGTAGLYLVKLDANGLPTSGFGAASTPGITAPSTVGASGVATGIAVDGSGNFVVALDTGGLVRFTPTGAIDTTFGGSGITPTTNGVSLHRKVVVQKNGGRILVSGQGTAPEQVVISSYWP